MSLQAVIFDFGGVICFPPSEDQWAEAARFCGVEVSRFKDAFWEYRDDYDCGSDPYQYWNLIARGLGKTFDDSMISGLIDREIAFWSRFDGRVLAWTDQLKRAGIRTGILSNLPRPLGMRLRNTPGFLDRFDQITFSYEIRFIKPQPEIYAHSIQGLGVAPKDALFLDDRLDNVEGARATGLQAEQFFTWEEFVGAQIQNYELPLPSRSLVS